MTDHTPTPRLQITGGNAPIAEQLALYYEQLEADVAALLTHARDDLPPTMESDDDIALVADFVKRRVKPTTERIKASEELEKRPLMTATDETRGFFRAMQDRLDKMMAVLNKRVKVRQDAVAEQKRIAAAEEARKLREQQLEAQRIADAARENANRAQAEAAANDAKRAGIQAQAAETASVAKGADHARVRSTAGATATVQTFWTHEVLDLQAIPPAMLWPFVSDEAKRVAIGAFVKAGNRELPGVRIYEDTRPTYR